MLTLHDLSLVQTCVACPEQYDVFHGGFCVGYLRLRHGHFTVAYPNYLGRLIYSSYTVGDGAFEPGERHRHLTGALKAILKELNKGEQGEI